jgi:hypothetical protein
MAYALVGMGPTESYTRRGAVSFFTVDVSSVSLCLINEMRTMLTLEHGQGKKSSKKKGKVKKIEVYQVVGRTVEVGQILQILAINTYITKYYFKPQL